MAERIHQEERVAARGTWGTVEWAFDARRAMPARDFFLALDANDQHKLLALFQRLAEAGQIWNHEKFKGLGGEHGLWEFKSFQVRVLGDFRPGHRFVLAHGLRKKQDKINPNDILVAVRVLRENDAVEKGGR